MSLQQPSFINEQEPHQDNLPVYRGASPASRIRLQESVRRLLMNVICGRKCGESLAKFAPDGLWVKMYGDFCQARMDGSFEEYSGILPEWGMMLDGVVIELPMSERFTPESELQSLLGTSTAVSRPRSEKFRVGRCPNPMEAINLFPTPTAMDSTGLYKTPRKNANLETNHALTCTQACYRLSTLKIHPEFLEAMMGLPIGWTALEL